MSKFLDLVQTCDAHLKAGETRHVARRLAEVSPSGVPREWRLPLARICRRVGLIRLGLRLLAPYVRPPSGRRIHAVATPGEVAEYAALLNFAGAVTEALRLLEAIDALKASEANLFRAFCHFQRWEYAAAVTPLENYLAAPLEPYARSVGQVNLASALVVVGRLAEADALLDRLIEEFRSSHLPRLAANCLEMKAQIHIQLGEFAKARAALQSSFEVLGGDVTQDRLFVQKWLSVIESREKNDPSPLRKFRRKALRWRFWEGVREADLFLQRVAFDQDEFGHLYFGTPLAGYRQRIERELGRGPESDEFILGSKRGPRVDVRTGEVDGGRSFNPGKETHRLVEILLRDFYRPLSLGNLFAELFPRNHFDIESSPDRLHQALRRARRWLEEAGLPIEIREEHGHYRLLATDSISFRVRIERPGVDWNQIQWYKTLALFSDGQPFSRREAHVRLGLSETSFKRFVGWALERRKLIRTGDGRNVRYQVAA